MNNIENCATAAVRMPSRRMFAPYFRARWQNMQNIVNDTQFFALIPPRFLTYYRTYIQQWMQWSRGFVPQLHKQDFFSTGMGYTVCDIFARECMSGGWRINSKDEDTNRFFESWGKANFETLFNEMFFDASAGGNALLCLTPINGNVYPSVLGANRFVFDIGRSGKITHAILFNRFNTGDDAFYAYETRMMMDGRAYYMVRLQRGEANALSPTWDVLSGYATIPEEVRAQWEYCYGNIKPNVWYRLPPALGIGLYNVKNKSVAVAIADIPGYSDSTLHTALDVLYSIDFNYTSWQMDMYWGRTRILLPKEQQSRAITSPGIMQPHLSASIDNMDSVQEAQLADDVYCKVVDSSSVDGKSIQPEFIQPDLRGEAHKYIRDADLELLASKVGLAAATLANHLQSYSMQKTATQVVSEMDTTEISVNNKRALASVAINEMLNNIGTFYGLENDAKIIWNRYGVNSPQENATLLSEYQSGIMTKREYIKRRFPDLTDRQIETWIAELRDEEPPMMRDYNLGGF